MGETQRIADQMKRAFEGEAWHGPSMLEALENVTAEQAAARPIPTAHSILEIVLHVGGWEDVIRRRITGESANEPDEGDWPAAGATSEAAWAAALERLKRNNAALRAAVEGLTDAKLDEFATGSKSSVYATLHGAIQHCLYHAGQVSMLKKAEA